MSEPAMSTPTSTSQEGESINPTAALPDSQPTRQITIVLHQTGLSIQLNEPTETIYFLEFSTLKFGEIPSVPEGPIATLNVIGIIGCVKLGPGYLIAVTEQNRVFERKNTTIWNIKRSLVIPLKFELAKGVLTTPTGKSSPTRPSTESNSDDDQSTDTSSTAPTTTTPSTTNITEKLTKQKDMLFSKLGVYANDLKSNASLSLSNQRVNKLSFDEFGGSIEMDEAIQSDNSSFKLNRAITLKGIPKKFKDTKTIPFLEKAKVRKYSTLNLESNISNEMLYKIERQLQSFYSTGDFYYSTDLDLTKHIFFEDEQMKTKNDGVPNSFYYNEFIAKDIPQLLQMPVVQGFINSFPVTFQSNNDTSKSGMVLLLSKRSTLRAGSRYLRRGIDDSGNVANFVFTSQFLIIDEYIPNRTLFTKFDIMRGSIPIFFQQDPSKLKPIPYLTRSIEKCEEPFKKHFERLEKSYEDVACINLVERSKKEAVVGEAYEKLCQEHGIKFDWFDFHHVCRKMRFDKVVLILLEALQNGNEGDTVEKHLVSSGWADSLCEKTQSGIFRVNCVDCLDRTNLVQKFLAEYILEKYILEKYCLEKPEDFKKKYSNLWADNGDYISKQYSSTNALKGDYTRTSKRNYAGLLTDAFLTMSRYYSGYISDYFKQCFIDYLLGHQKEDIFEEFESTLNVLDPNEINENLNKNNSVLQKIIEQLKFDDDLILIGSWSGFLSPMVFNKLKLKNSSLKQVSLIVTSKKIFIIEFDEKKGEITQTITIEISDIKRVEYGTYILTNFNSISSNPKKNVGLKFFVEKAKEGSGNAVDDESSPYDFITVKFPQDMDYSKVKYIIELISKTCHSSTLENNDIITSTEASTNVIDVLEHRFKKMVWG